jgi:uncharacterized protein (DUF1778 family)
MDSITKKLGSQKKQANLNKESDVPNALSRKAKPGAYARFDTRLPRETKEILERAAHIKGFKSLSEFVIHFSSEAALSIIERHNQILASEKDQAIFFEALMNPPAPNKNLVKAAKRYKAQIAVQ